MTYGMTSCNGQAAECSAAVAMAAMTLRTRVRQIRDDLARLKAAQLDCCNCVRRDIDDMLTNIKVGADIMRQNYHCALAYNFQKFSRCKIQSVTLQVSKKENLYAAHKSSTSSK